MSEKDLKQAWEREMNKGMQAPERIVSPKHYDVLKSMVEDGLISGQPYSEYATPETIAEFHKRMEKP